MDIADDTKVQDNAQISLTPDTGVATLVRVKVLAASGVFKNGVQYNQGDIATITASSAEGLINNGDVELAVQDITPPAPAAPTPQGPQNV